MEVFLPEVKLHLTQQLRHLPPPHSAFCSPAGVISPETSLAYETLPGANANANNTALKLMRLFHQPLHHIKVMNSEMSCSGCFITVLF